MQITCITLFPDMLDALKAGGVVSRAIERGTVHFHAINPREYTHDVHRTVDDRPYGGGPGMVMKAEPMLAAIDAAKAQHAPDSRVVVMSPQGAPFDQAKAAELARLPGLILVAGRYEGIDERVMDAGVDDELSIGDYVLSGGELAAMVVIDSVVRLLPDVLGDARSAQYDSFVDGLLDHPHYTRPEQLGEHNVPSVLLGGDHKQIERWRLQQSLGRTWLRRPDLIARRTLSDEEQTLLDEFIAQHEHDTKRVHD
ncbi:MAG: tRNA (guanosine(37)-N1)-methyltransferase TrmD [Pseudomonadota bacterium]